MDVALGFHGLDILFGLWFVSLGAAVLATRPGAIPADPGAAAPPAAVGLVATMVDPRLVPRERAVVATFFDLVARGVVAVHRDRSTGEPLCAIADAAVDHPPAFAHPWEKRLFDHLRAVTATGPTALTTLTGGDPTRMAHLLDDIRDDLRREAVRRGLARRRFSTALIGWWTAGAVVLALLSSAADAVAGGRINHVQVEVSVGPALLVGLCLGWLILTARDALVPTEAGRRAVAAWRDRARLIEEGKVLRTARPGDVPAADLAEGVALAVAPAAAAAVDLSTPAIWSAGSRGRRIVISFPEPVDSPVAEVVFFTVSIVSLSLCLVLAARFLADYGAALLPAAGLCGYGLVRTVGWLRDATRALLRRRSTSARACYVGAVLLTRRGRGSAADRYWVALDDGTSTDVTAWVTDRDTADALRPGDRVEVTVDPRRHRLLDHVVVDPARR